ncbi:MAG: ferredoxin--NADP reductase [Litorivicinaceae bacterium]|nr:ferredoxin--NADP reductase [Litorivicinaceae bacterium]
MNLETVLSVRHYSDDLFSFQTTRSADIRAFKAGQFTMIGMGDNDILRAYSIASAPTDSHLEFLSIKVQDGPLTSRLQHIQAGDQIEVGDRPTGTLVLDNLLPGQRLWCIATGTGLAPFLSIVRDPSTFARFDEVILTHTVRTARELAFAEMLESRPIRYYPTVTREAFHTEGRITDRLASGAVFEDLNLPQWSADCDRIMICGSPAFNNELRADLQARGFQHGTNRAPGHFVQERAFVMQRGDTDVSAE